MYTYRIYSFVCIYNNNVVIQEYDQVLLAPDSRSLEAALLVLDQVARKWAMSVNYDKTIGVVVTPQQRPPRGTSQRLP